MQELNIQQRDCRHSTQAEQLINCSQKLQRLRCCGRVLSRQEADSEIVKKNQGQRLRKRLRQGQGKCLGNGQGQHSGQSSGNLQG